MFLVATHLRSVTRLAVRVLVLTCTTLLLTGRSAAGDWYVDALHGDDSADGQGTASAWRTLTHALGNVPAGQQHTLHVAPGTYDSAHGESFPLIIPALVRVHGTQGSGVTILAGAGSGTNTLLSVGGAVGAETGASGFTLRDARVGLRVWGGSAPAQPSFEDLVVHGMSEVGVLVAGSANPGSGSHWPRPTLRRCSITSCLVGLRLTANSYIVWTAGASAILVDTTIRDCTLDGLYAHGDGFVSFQAILERCRVIDNGRHGVYLQPELQEFLAALVARDTLIAGNAQHGIHGTNDSGSLGFVDLERCTIARNGGTGMRAMSRYQVRFRGTLVAGNQQDVSVPHPIDALYSNSPSGAFNGLPGCIAADPLFTDADAGDFRLAWGSPCIDAGDPLVLGGLDLQGQARPLDGNLDTVARIDMGAFEFRPFEVLGAARLGAAVDCVAWGEPGAMGRLLVTLSDPVPPRPTIFGRLELDRALLQIRPMSAVPAVGPAVWQLQLPTGAGWIGRPLALQTLIASSSAPFGSALGNLRVLVIEP